MGSRSYTKKKIPFHKNAYFNFFLYLCFHFLFIGFQTMDHITLSDEISLLVILSDPWLPYHQDQIKTQSSL